MARYAKPARACLLLLLLGGCADDGMRDVLAGLGAFGPQITSCHQLQNKIFTNAAPYLGLPPDTPCEEVIRALARSTLGRQYLHEQGLDGIAQHEVAEESHGSR